MKKNWLLGAALSLFALSMMHIAIAMAAPSPGPLPSSLVAASAPGSAQAVSAGNMLQATGDTIHAWGGLGWQLKIAAVILLLVASMKVSFLSKYWDKLGEAQALLAPALGLVGGILELAYQHAISLPGALAYLSAGAGALLLHELLDAVKAIPGLGAGYVALISAVEGALGGSSNGGPQEPPKDA